MDAITKRSYIQFLLLYLVSSLTLLAFASYYFYSSRVSMGKQNLYYKMTHIADMQGLSIIEAYMQHKPLSLQKHKGFVIALYGADGKKVAGEILQSVDFSKDFYTRSGVTTLVSTSSAMHHGIKYVVVQTRLLAQNQKQCLKEIVVWTMIIASIIVIVAVILSSMFLRPLKERAKAIERFVKDTTHELNTPISALMMSLERLKSKKNYDERIVQNLQISAKNLHEIYESLAFVSFSHHKHKDEDIDFKDIVVEQIEFFEEIAKKKRLIIESELKSTPLHMAPIKAKMFISNLLSNAIKYSYPNKTIRITLDPKKLTVEDEGIGIKKDDLERIFGRFVRANDYAGGFGVGMSIVREIVKEYGFKIEIDSKVNEGTKITVRFPSTDS